MWGKSTRDEGTKKSGHSALCFIMGLLILGMEIFSLIILWKSKQSDKLCKSVNLYVFKPSKEPEEQKEYDQTDQIEQTCRDDKKEDENLPVEEKKKKEHKLKKWLFGSIVGENACFILKVLTSNALLLFLTICFIFLGFRKGGTPALNLLFILMGILYLISLLIPKFRKNYSALICYFMVCFYIPVFAGILVKNIFFSNKEDAFYYPCILGCIAFFCFAWFLYQIRSAHKEYKGLLSSEEYKLLLFPSEDNKWLPYKKTGNETISFLIVTIEIGVAALTTIGVVIEFVEKMLNNFKGFYLLILIIHLCFYLIAEYLKVYMENKITYTSQE